jgi:hypothetical protein
MFKEKKTQVYGEISIHEEKAEQLFCETSLHEEIIQNGIEDLKKTNATIEGEIKTVEVLIARCDSIVRALTRKKEQNEVLIEALIASFNVGKE